MSAFFEYAYCKFNNTESGQQAKALVSNGDVDKLSIYANKLKSQANNVIHGIIREVSLVLAGANPGAYIDSIVVHGEGADAEEEATIYTDEHIEVAVEHSDEEDIPSASEEPKDDSKGDEVMEDNKKEETLEHSEKTVQEVVDSMTEEQKTVLYLRRLCSWIFSSL